MLWIMSRAEEFSLVSTLLIVYFILSIFLVKPAIKMFLLFRLLFNYNYCSRHCLGYLIFVSFF